MNSEFNELEEYLFKIAKRSFKGEIAWNQPNPSTFVWIQNEGDQTFQVTIQRAQGPRIIGARGLQLPDEKKDKSTYLFQVQDRSQKQTFISLSSKERPELFGVLSEIYHGAEQGMDVRATNVLKKLLGE